MDERKIKLIQSRLDKKEVLLVLNKYNLFYLTQTNLDGYFLTIAKDNVKVFGARMLFSQLKEIFKDLEVVVDDSIEKQIPKIIENRKILLIDDEEISVKKYNILKKYFKVRFSSLIKDLRIVKDESEISKIKKAAKVVKKVLKETKNFIKEGVTEIDVKNFILKKFLEYNVEPSFEPIVAFDENTSYPHHISTSKKFRRNSLVLIDLGCKYKGYCCDVTKMYNFDKNRRIKDLYLKLKNLQEFLVSLCKPGVKVKMIDKYARDYFKKLGLEEKYLHSTGHGLGVEIHEPPRVSIKDNTTLQDGMVITIEPGIYFDKDFGLRIEDDVVCGSNPTVITRRYK